MRRGAHATNISTLRLMHPGAVALPYHISAMPSTRRIIQLQLIVVFRANRCAEWSNDRRAT